MVCCVGGAVAQILCGVFSYLVEQRRHRTHVSEQLMTGQTSHPSRRPVQWSLRCLLVTVAVCAAYFSVFRLDPSSTSVFTLYVLPMGVLLLSRHFLGVHPFWTAVSCVTVGTLIPVAFAFIGTWMTAFDPPPPGVAYMGGDGWGRVFFATWLIGWISFFWSLISAIAYGVGRVVGAKMLSRRSRPPKVSH
jgi:hypothetical protein